MVRCPGDAMTPKNKESNNQRILMLEEKVSNQAETIEQLQKQLHELTSWLRMAPMPEIQASEHSEDTNSNGHSTSEEGLEEVKKDTAVQVAPPVQYNYKNLLQEHCVKQGWEFPTYSTTKSIGGFCSVITLNDDNHTSKTMKSKVLAEKSAACVLLQSLNVIDDQGVPVADGDPRKNSGVSKYSWCKNQLQEYFAKCGQPYPTYNIMSAAGKGFIAEVVHDRFEEKVEGAVGISKRIAEQMAAHKAISVWKIVELNG